MIGAGHFGARWTTRWAIPSALFALSGGVYWDHLWLGREEPRIGPLSLAASGGAVVGVAAEDLLPGPLVDAMFGFQAGSTATAAAPAADPVGLISDYFAFFVLIRALSPGPPSTNRHVLGRRDPASPFAGHELAIRTGDGRPFWRIDPGVPPAIDLIPVHDVTDGLWHAIVGRVTPTGAQLATELAVASSATVGLAAAAPTVDFSVGRGRLAAYGCHVAAVGVTRSSTVEALDAQALAQVLYAEVVDQGGQGVAGGEIYYLTTGEPIAFTDGAPALVAGGP